MDFTGCRLGPVRAALFLLFLFADRGLAQTSRLVLIKADGIPFYRLEQFVKERNPETGKSRLPWIDFLFYRGGTRLANFYVRGISLSAPSWSLLDTGQTCKSKVTWNSIEPR